MRNLFFANFMFLKETAIYETTSNIMVKGVFKSVSHISNLAENLLDFVALLQSMHLLVKTTESVVRQLFSFLCVLEVPISTIFSFF